MNHEKQWDVLNAACSCNNKCYGYSSCDCNKACYTGDSCGNCHHTVGGYSNATCTCNGCCYGEADVEDASTAADSATQVQREMGMFIAPRLYTCTTEYYDGDPQELTDDFTDYPLVFDENPKTEEEWTAAAVSALSAWGYVATGGRAGQLFPDAIAETTSYKQSADLSHAYMTVGWDTPRPVVGIHVYKDDGLLHSAYRPVRRTGVAAHWSSDVVSGNSGITFAGDALTNYPATRLGDGDLGTEWISPNTTSSWKVSADLGAAGASAFSYYSLIASDRTSVTNYKYRRPRAFQLCACNNPTGGGGKGDWEKLDVRTAITWGSEKNSKRTFALSSTNTTAYRYYALYITQTQGDYKGTASYCELAGIEFRVWEPAAGSETQQTTQCVTTQYLSAGSKIKIVPTISLVDDYIIDDCPSGNYFAIARLTGQGGLL